MDVEAVTCLIYHIQHNQQSDLRFDFDFGEETFL